MRETIEWLLRCAAAELLVLGALYVACGVGQRLLPAATSAMRWTAICVAGMWLATVAFHLLLELHAFALPAALALMALAAAAVFLAARGRGGVVPRVRRDLARLAALLRPDLGHPAASAAKLLAVVFLCLIGLRAVLVPVVSWDSLTYHAVKAGLWVQRGGPLELVAPGGWSIYGSYLGGGEIFQAWAMLPFRGDLLVGAVDIAQWMFLGIAAWALAEQAELPRGAQWIGAAYFVSLPAVARPLGSLYVDNTVALALLAGLALALHAVRNREARAGFLALGALGVAVGIKIFAAPVAAALAPTLALLLLARTRRFKDAVWLVAGLLAAALAAGPWLAHNWRAVGLPLSPLPVTVAGLKLGEANDAFRWYMQRPQLEEASLGDEFTALLEMLGGPWIEQPVEPWLGLPTAVALVLFLVGLLRRGRNGLPLAFLSLALVVPLLVSFYGSSMKYVRLLWAPTSGRYLVAAAGVVIVLSFTCWKRAGTWMRIYGGLLVVAALVHLVRSDLFGWTPRERIVSGAATVALLGASLLWIAFRGKLRARPGLARSVLLLAPLVGMGSLQVYRGATRGDALKTSIVLHSMPRYWVDAALLVDEPHRPRRLAVTAGPWQNADNWFLYPFLGSRLQNELVYVPVTRDGSIIDLARSRQLAAEASFPAWLERLERLAIDEVLSFEPTSTELLWMEQRPELFARVAGDRRRWGLYRLTAPGPRRGSPIHR